MKFLALFLVIVSSCTKKVEFDTQGISPSLRSVEWEISDLQEGTWAVGSLWRDVISKNLTVVVKMPEMRNSDIEEMEKNYAVDSWLIKVIHKTSAGHRQHLATILAPMRSKLKGGFSTNQTRSVAFSLTYAAWAMSERFRKFQCPAFSHRARLKEFLLESSDHLMEFNLSSIGKFHESYLINELVPPKIIIAQSMRGEFYLEVALFSTKSKTLFSSFQQIPSYISVKEEKQVSVSGCEGVQQEYER